MIKTLAIAYFVASVILFVLFLMAVYSMKKQAIAEGYTFPKHKQDPCRRFLAIVMCIFIFCCPILRFAVSLYPVAAAVLGMTPEIEMLDRIWDEFLKDAHFHC